MKSVYEYIDYRKYLADYYQARKAETKFFSFRYFAQKAGINSSSFLKKVIDGSRGLTPSACDKFCKALGFRKKESLYFRHLVLFNQASSASDKQLHYAVLRKIAGSVQETVLLNSQLEYFSQWYFPVIRELCCLLDFQDDISLLAKSVKPEIGAVQARKAVKLLEKLNLIRKKSDGRYEQTSSAITVDEDAVSLAQKTYVASIMRMAGDAVENFRKDVRHTSTMTIGISPKSFQLLNAEIESFKDRVKAIVGTDKESSRVYQLNLALFPVSIETQKSGGTIA